MFFFQISMEKNALEENNIYLIGEIEIIKCQLYETQMTSSMRS